MYFERPYNVQQDVPASRRLHTAPLQIHPVIGWKIPSDRRQAALSVENIVFERGSNGPREGYVQVTLPLGPEARWPQILATAEPDELEAASRTVDPTGKVKLGKVFKVVLTLPGRVVAQGTRPETCHMKTKVIDATPPDAKDVAKYKNHVATLVVPLGTV